MYSSFDVMSAIFPIFFILVAVLVVFTIIWGLAEWNKNNQSPRLTVDAKVVSKRENTTHYQDNANCGEKGAYMKANWKRTLLSLVLCAGFVCPAARFHFPAYASSRVIEAR